MSQVLGALIIFLIGEMLKNIVNILLSIKSQNFGKIIIISFV